MASVEDKTKNDKAGKTGETDPEEQVKQKSDPALDPLRLREVCLNNDFYTLCWSCLRTDIWNKKLKFGWTEEDEGEDEDKYQWMEKTIGGEQLSLTSDNIRSIKVLMTLFIVIILYVLIGILHQVFTGEIEASCTWDIRLLRILLVSLVQMKLFNEFREGLVKLKFVYNHEHLFIENGFAKFIPLFQITCTLLSWVTLVLFICSETDPLSMIQDFTGICVFTELDDWVGGHICATEPDVDEEEQKYYDFTNINDRISLQMKMSKLQYDTNIVEDLNDDGSFLKKFTYTLYADKILIYLLPLLCIPVEWAYLKYHPYAK
mmetsp:Transcript_18472/g.19093  ORF Transcript_18472/g.19093 Transcript_18472/m.19093 type:complete len:318 (-) Transcript_18472:108-1061(-)